MENNKNFNDNDRANKLNPNNELFWKSRGYPGRPENWQEELSKWTREYSPDEIKNRANQLNPSHEAYWKSRGQTPPWKQNDE